MIVYLIIVAAVAVRFLTHFSAPSMANIAPITALAIFSAVYLPKKQAIAIPLAARFASDLFIGFFSWPLMVAVYLSHLSGLLLGFWIKSSASNKTKWIKVLGSGFAAAAIFFLVTNFAFLYPTYSHDLSGIVAAYVNGLPFLRGTLIGDVGYTVALFGTYEAVRYLSGIKRIKPSQNLA